MTVRKVDTSEIYDTLTEWWEKHSFPVLSPDFVSNETLVVYNEQGIMTHSIFFYHTNSNLCWIGFPVSNPELSREDKKGCFQMLINGAVEYAKELNYKFIFTTSPMEVVQNKLVNSGFTLGDEGVNHYIKKLS